MRRAALLLAALVLVAASAAAAPSIERSLDWVLDNPRATADFYNNRTDRVPDVLATVIADERINVHIETEQGNRTVGLVLDGLRVSEVRDGGLENRTLDVRTNASTVRRIVEADAPAEEAVNAYNSGAITVEAHTTTTGILTAILSFVSRIFGFLF